MAWTDIASFVAGEIINATRMNQLRDNFRYLKGTDGAVQIDAAVTVASASSGSNPAVSSRNDASVQTNLYTGRSGLPAISGKTILENAGGNPVCINPSGGGAGVGTLNPRGVLHVAGSRGGWMHWSGELNASTLDIVPDGTGDVVRGLIGQYVCHDVTTGVTTGGQLSLREPDNDGAQFGGIGAGIRILTDGTVRLYRTTTDTYHISLQLVWL